MPTVGDQDVSSSPVASVLAMFDRGVVEMAVKSPPINVEQLVATLVEHVVAMVRTGRSGVSVLEEINVPLVVSICANRALSDAPVLLRPTRSEPRATAMSVIVSVDGEPAGSAIVIGMPLARLNARIPAMSSGPPT